MLRIVIGIVLVIHGLIHLLYVGHSRRIFELQPGLRWPDGAWSTAALLGTEANRWLASGACVLAALGFMAGGLALLAGGSWRPLVAWSAAFSAMLFLLFWDGRMRKLDGKGGFALLINGAILIAMLATS